MTQTLYAHMNKIKIKKKRMIYSVMIRMDPQNSPNFYRIIFTNILIQSFGRDVNLVV
jgi:hypothetical protein